MARSHTRRSRRGIKPSPRQVVALKLAHYLDRYPDAVISIDPTGVVKDKMYWSVALPHIDAVGVRQLEVIACGVL